MMLRSLPYLFWLGGGAWRGQTALARNAGLSQSFDPVWTVGRAFLQLVAPPERCTIGQGRPAPGRTPLYDKRKPRTPLIHIVPNSKLGRWAGVVGGLGY